MEPKIDTPTISDKLLVDSTIPYASTEEVKTFKVVETLTKNSDIIQAEYLVDKDNKLQSGLLITFVTPVNTAKKRTGVIKVPKTLIEGLSGWPIEIQGCPIEILIQLAHDIKKKEGTSILENQKKLIL